MGKRITMFTLPLRHSAVVGCYSFAPFGGVSMLHPLPPGVARGWHINAPSGRKPDVCKKTSKKSCFTKLFVILQS